MYRNSNKRFQLSENTASLADKIYKKGSRWSIEMPIKFEYIFTYVLRENKLEPPECFNLLKMKYSV